MHVEDFRGLCGALSVVVDSREETQNVDQVAFIFRRDTEFFKSVSRYFRWERAAKMIDGLNDCAAPADVWMRCCHMLRATMVRHHRAAVKHNARGGRAIAIYEAARRGLCSFPLSDLSHPNN